MPNNLNILLEVATLPSQTLDDVQTYAPIRGAAGADGTDGKEVTLRVLSQILQWKYTTDSAYINLFDFATLNLPISQITSLQTTLDGKASLSGSYSNPAWITALAASKINQDASYRFVTDTEKTTWNAKQNALTNPVTGTGTTNYLMKWGITAGQSLIFDNGSFVGLNTTTNAGFLFDVNGTARIVGKLTATADATSIVSIAKLLECADVRNTSTNPSAFSMGLVTEFKTASAVAMNGLPFTGGYTGVITFRPYSVGGDFSGGGVGQLGFTDTGYLFYRYGTSASVWGSWNRLAFLSNRGYLGLNATPVSQLHSVGEQRATTIGNTTNYYGGGKKLEPNLTKLLYHSTTQNSQRLNIINT
jgi:hypothetical protein